MSDAIATLETLLNDIRQERRARPHLLLQLYEVASFIEATKAALGAVHGDEHPVLEKAMSAAADAFAARVRRSLEQDAERQLGAVAPANPERERN